MLHCSIEDRAEVPLADDRGYAHRSLEDRGEAFLADDRVYADKH